MKTSTNGHRAGVLMTAAFALFTVLSVTAQFGTQESIVPNRIPPADIPGISGDGGNSSQRAPSGSISVAENATYNAMTPQQLVQNVLVTGCLQAENIRFGYYNRNNGNWTNHTWSSTPGNRMLGYFERATSGFALEEGLVLSTGRISSAMGPNNNAGRSDQMVSNASDPDLATISGRTMYDAAVLEFDFIPAGNTVEFKYVFASEEYLEYVHTNFNDAFGFFLSGPGISGPYSNNAINLATLPNGEDVTINTIHPAGVNTNGQSYPAHNAEYYIDNPSGSLTMQFDGYTVELTATYPVTPCATYRIKMAIADASDQQYDAAVFLGARSFNAETLSLTHFGNGIQNNNNIFEGCTNNRLVVTRMTTDLTEDYHVDLILAGSAINGSDILTSGGQPFPTQIVIPAGQASYEIPYYAVNDGTGDNAETFIVRVRNSCPCDENISYVEEVINIYEQVTIASVSATNAQCAGQSNGVITINATGGSGSYQYSINNGTTWQSSNTFTGLSAGSYTVLVRDPGSCYEPVSAAATIGEPQPIVANAGSDVSICSGTSTQLNGTGGVLYSWSPATGLSNPSIANPVASPAVTTTYTLTVTNASGQCASTDQVIVTVNPSPVITVNPAEVEVCRGTEVTITASGAASYVWNPGGATSASITVSPVSNTSYTVTGTAANGCTGTASSLVIVKATPNNVSAGPDAGIGLCETHQLQGSATGSGTLLYTWAPATGLSNANIANPVFTPSTSGTFTFTLTVTNQASGCSVSDEMSIEVAEPLSVTSVVNNNSCTTVADGSINITVTGGSAPYTYSWTGPNGYTAGTEDLSNIVAGTYSVLVTDADGCTFNGNYTVGTVPDTTPPTASNPADIVLSGCNGTFPGPDILVVTDEDDNCETPVVAWVSDGSPVLDGCIETIVRTYSVTDGSGNSINVYQNLVRTVDTEAPVISTAAVSGDLGCNPEVVAPAFTGLDNCAGVFTPEVSTLGASNEGCAYTQTWTANYTDACGNVAEAVSITYTWTVDTEAPVISTAAVSGDLGCNPEVVAPVFTGLDNCAGEFAPEVSTLGASNEGCAYTQTWTANYTDACGNVAEEVSITYTWTVDTEAPVISTAAVSGDLGCNPEVVAPAFTGLDNCAGEFAPEVSTEGPSNEGCAYTQTWTANYTDACGNVAEAVSITYTWAVDTEAPVISTAAVSGDLGCNPEVVAPAFTGLDNCAGVFTPEVSTLGASNEGCAYTQTWTANYTDACGNVAEEVSITYTWTVDTEAPVISTAAVSGNLGCNPEVVAPAFTGLDNCAGEFAPEVSTEGPSNEGCAYTQTWTANYTDACGNVAEEVSITYTWTVDTEAPVISTAAVSGDLGCNPEVVAPAFTGLDNCAGEFTPEVSTEGPSNEGCAYTQTWTANYTDACGNVAEAVSITYTWTVDTEAPVISTAAVSGDLGCNPEVVAPAFTGLDNCAGVFTPEVSTEGASNEGCAYTQTWTANYTDACGNVAEEVSTTYTWTVDTEAPVISTAAVSGDLGCNPEVVAPAFTGLDNCAGVFTPEVSTEGASNEGCAYTQTWTANYTDACGNVAEEVSITYTWTVDTEAPVISTAAVSGDLGCNPEVVAPAFTGLDNCAGVFTPEVSTEGASNEGCAYTQTWTANYTDACGNVAEAVSITYTWTVDTEAPVISTAAVSGDLGCNPEVVAPAFTGLDNCAGVFTPEVSTEGASNEGCAYTQTWTANYTDACGNVAEEVSITYTWTVDTEAPVISTAAVSGDLGCNPEVVAPAFTGLDNCAGVFTPEVSTEGASNEGCAYTQTWTANYTDACGNVAEEVSITYTWTVDTEAPVISTAAVSGDLGCNPEVVAPAFTGLDNCAGVFTPEVSTEGASNEGCAYTQTWTANYTDACGNVAEEVSITYTWTVDTEAPVISTAAVSGDLGCNPEVVAPAFTGLDNCAGEFAPEVSTEGPSNEGCAYTQTWTANYTDACGNVAEAVSITYTWAVDTEAPVISTAAVSGDLGCNPEVVAPAFTGLDNCAGVFTPEVSTEGASNEGCAYTQTWTANYTDACGNVAEEVSITYTWTVDTEAPVISTAAVSGDLGCNPEVVAPAFTGLDNCAGVFTPEVSTEGASNEGCAYTQTWTANYTDACGNVAEEVSITYTWTVDTEAPVISTAAVSGDLGCNPEVVAPAFTGLDNCAGEFAPEVSTEGPSNEGCAYTQTWTANYTDACGNVAEEVSITYTWTVDTEAPVISTAAVSGDLGCNPEVVAPAFTGLDNCAGEFAPEVSTEGPSNEGCAYTQTWTANYTDACGNVAEEVSITYTWTVDTEAPVISTAAVSGDLGCNPEVVAPAFTGLDNCAGVFTPEVSTEGASNEGCAYTQTWTANYTDACGNVAEEVSITYTWTVDTEAPVISTAAVSGDLGCNPEVVAPAFTGLDNCAGVFTPEVSTEGASNEGCAYTQTWTANYTDACGNVAEEVSITYTWTVDTEAPVISTAAVSGDLGCNPEVVAPAFTGLDNCAGEFAPEVSTEGPSNEGCAYTQTWTANYTDACGNVAEAVSITYTWAVDTEAPVISTAAVSGDLGCNPEVVAPAFTGLDNCAGVFTPEVSTEGASNEGCAYTQTWTANYTDACGNVAEEVSITYTWTVDTEAPVISTAAVSGDLGCNPEVVAPAFTGLDNCAGVFTPEVSTEGASNEGCAYTQTWTANYTDACGNVAEEVSITYTWTVDTEAPVISTAAVSGDLGCNPEVVAPAFTGLDNCAGVFTPEVSTLGASNEGCAYTQTWTANYTDACGNVAEEVSITYTWTVDTEAPVISTTAVSGDLGCNPEVVAPAFTGLDNCAGEFTPEVSTEGASNEGCAYTQTWTANYTDACGNVAEEVSITYTWTVDTEAPVISTVAVSGDLGCNPEVVAPAFTGLDNCAGVFTPEVSTLGASNEGCAYTQTWTANYTDACGNVAEEVSITYTWTVDTDAPVFTNAPADLTVNCNGSGNTGDLNNWLNSAVAEDICGEVTITHDFEGISDLCGATGSATVTWTATDNCGNQATTTATFTIVDTQAPELTCPQNIVAVTEPGMCGAWIVVPVPAAIDACGEVTLMNNITGTNNATGSYPLGVTTIIWTATDECGNISTCSMTITINDNEDPHIICPQHITINNDPGVCEAFVNVPQPVVSDNCEIRTLVNTYTQTDDASAVYPVGTTVVWWTVVDMSGNSSSCFMNITVVDAEAPVIVCPEDIAVSTDPGVCEAYVTVPLPEVSDNCGVENVTNSFNGADDASGTYPVGTTTVIWTVTDVNGHIAECSMTVTVSDNELPAIDCPEDIAVSTDPGVCEAYVTVPQPVVSDNCGIESVVNSFNGTGDASGIYPTGTTTINWTVFDIHGNQSECVMTVTVTDNELPVIGCPEDINVNTDPGVCEANVTVPQPVVSDNCGIELVVNSFNGTDNASGIYPTGTTTVVWTVTDIHGLTSTCEMTITVTDNELPVIECPEDITVVAGAGCTALVEIPEPVVSDNCGIESVVSSTGAAGSIELPAGIHEVSWIATDIHGNQASCSILVTVIAGPIANDDNDVTEMNIPVSVPVLENDTDCDNNIDPSTVTVITNPANGFTMVDPQNGNILYTPNTGFHGTDTFIYRVCDLSGLCDDATVTIVIEGEDPPAPIYLIAVADLDTTLVNTPRLITNMFNDIVPEGITAGIEILTQPSNGYLELHSDMTVTYTPATDFTGMDEFTYILYDINGVAISDTAVSVIVVVPDPGRAEIIIYNGITPNGDGRNDNWIIDGIEEYGDNEILLFNRWGDQVRYFENYNNTTVVWDGTNKNGKILPDGTYYYIVKLRSVNEIYTGWVIIHGSK